MVDHEVILRGANLGAAQAGPLILKRTDQEFIPALLDELASARGLEAVSARAMDQSRSSAPASIAAPVDAA